MRACLFTIAVVLWAPFTSDFIAFGQDPAPVHSQEQRSSERKSDTPSSEAVPQPEALSLDPATVFHRVVAGPGGNTAATGSERLLYSNTRGSFAINFPPNQPVSDDIAITAANGCNLTRYRFKVHGKYSPTGASGPYTVTYGLYSNCPLAVGSTAATRDLVKIPGTDGVIAFDDDAPREIEHVVDPKNSVALPTNFYLSLRFNRSNCGTIVGAPASVGFSGDVWDFPGFPCNGFLGGFPGLPHASYWAEFFGDETCKEAHLGYKAARASGGASLPGANIQAVDDVQLLGGPCNMVGYEVTVRGVGFYTFDLRQGCEGPIIPGTERNLAIFANSQPLLQVARFSFDPPIPIPQNLWLGFKSSSNSSGAVIAGVEPWVGESSSDYFVVNLDGCASTLPIQGVYGAVNLSIVCDGTPSLGACCDYHFRDEQGEAVCREIPQVNCSICGSEASDPALCPWLGDTACDPDPFPYACGVAACCRPDDTCENLTQNQCADVPPLDRPREWHLGQFCEDPYHECKFTACLIRQGECMRVHEGTGCIDPFCCQSVCEFDPWCCQVEWDEVCLRWADASCSGAPGNDQCAPDFPIRGLSGAFELPMPGIFYGTNTKATLSPIEPGFCCHGGVGVCVGGAGPGSPCVTDTDCQMFPGNPATCTEVTPMPAATGEGTVWHKFVATHTTAKITTCGSKAWDNRFADSLLQVYAAQNMASPLAACNSLSVIACNDDAGSDCPNEPNNAAICVGGLIPGQTYYVLLASKLMEHQGLYRITTSAPCEPTLTVPGDSCFAALDATDGVTPFDTTGATFDCPAEACAPDAQNDIWFHYTATCRGQATFSTCGDGNPDTNIAVYDECDSCPAVSNNQSSLACNADSNSPGCIDPARVEVFVLLGNCYTVRIADTLGFPAAGELTVHCESFDCQPNGIPDDKDIASCPPGQLPCRDCNFNGIPDGCEITTDSLIDLNLNGKIDSCETCPTGLISLLSPSSGFVDARRPHVPGSPNELQGIDTVVVAGFPGAEVSCWSVCESAINPKLHPPYAPALSENTIIGVSEEPAGQFTLKLERPITPGEATFVRYTDDEGQSASVRLLAHPGNVNGNSITNPADILTLIDVINGVAFAPWGLLSTDCDHSGLTAPADILCVIDLLNTGWNGTVRPAFSECP